MTNHASHLTAAAKEPPELGTRKDSVTASNVLCNCNNEKNLHTVVLKMFFVHIETA